MTTSPPIDGQNNPVGLRMWLWIDPTPWVTWTATAELPTISATLTAEPTDVEWDLGNNDTLHCDNPGTPYNLDLTEDQQPNRDCTYV